jgi:hypothetical protein
MTYKDTKWATQIIALQNDDGTWGEQFHILSVPNKKYPLTTEQALRRLLILGFDISHEPIQRCLNYMTACLRGERKMDNSWEKQHNWHLFSMMMLATWVKLIEPDNDLALDIARQRATVIEEAFHNGYYIHEKYVKAYVNQFKSKPRGGREVDFANFYAISLLQGVLTPQVESLMLDLILEKTDGIYYIYDAQLKTTPTVFASKQTSHYLSAMEILACYSTAKAKLGFVVEWLNAHQDGNTQWDLGAVASDGVYFPRVESWRKAANRKADCTERILSLLSRLR